MKLELKIGTKDFFRQFDELINYGVISLTKSSKPEILGAKFNKWEKKVKEFLKSNIPNIPNELISDFGDNFEVRHLYNDYYIDNVKVDYPNRAEQLQIHLEKKVRSVKITYDYLTISDILNEKEQPQLNTVSEKIFFALNKLYELDNNNYYSIRLIFILNNISYREEETNEIASELEKREYAKKNPESETNDFIKITVQGATYIERKKKTNSDKSESNREKDLNIKIDQLLSELRKLDELRFGQEIIFTEIEELRSDSKRLSKKSWAHLVKGKVFDLALEDIISKKTAKFIYESLVDDKFNLLS